MVFLLLQFKADLMLSTPINRIRRKIYDRDRLSCRFSGSREDMPCLYIEIWAYTLRLSYYVRAPCELCFKYYILRWVERTPKEIAQLGTTSVEQSTGLFLHLKTRHSNLHNT